MKKPQFKSQQSGFTLIELVVVIVILGILAATALPRFADMSSDARMAKMKAAAAAMRTANTLFHAQWLVAGSPADANTAASTVKLEGVAIGHVNGFPAGVVGDIDVAAGLGADYTVSAVGGVVTVADTAKATCKVTFTESTGLGVAPVIDDTTDVIPANC